MSIVPSLGTRIEGVQRTEGTERVQKGKKMYFKMFIKTMEMLADWRSKSHFEDWVFGSCLKMGGWEEVIVKGQPVYEGET